MDRRKQRFKKRTAVTKEQALNFLCANEAAEQNRETHRCCRETAMGSRSPAGPRRLGTATRISASLSRRLSAFFGSTSDQDPKAAKFAVLTPGRAGFPNRAKRSEGSDTTPIRNARVSPCKPLCAILLVKASVYPLSPVKTNVSRLCECDLKPLRRGLSHAIWDVRLQRISDRLGGYRRKAGLPPKPSEAGSVGRGDAAE